MTVRSHTRPGGYLPPFELPEYKGLKALQAPGGDYDEQVDADLEQIRQGHAQLRAVETPGPSGKATWR